MTDWQFVFLTTFTHFIHPLTLWLWQPPICLLSLWACFIFVFLFQISCTSKMQYLSFPVSLISLSVAPPKTIHVTQTAVFPYSLYGYVYIYIYMCVYTCMCVYVCRRIHMHTRHIFFIHSLIHGHLGFSCVGYYCCREHGCRYIAIDGEQQGLGWPGLME